MRSACGHASPWPSNAAAKRQRQCKKDGRDRQEGMVLRRCASAVTHTIARAPAGLEACAPAVTGAVVLVIMFVVQAFPPSLRFGEARLSAERGGGRPALAQQNPNAAANFVKIDAPVLALTIAAIGNAATVTVPEGATTIDLTGRTIVPGLVMMHEHLYYTTGPGVYGQLGASFSRLYLAGGVTTMRTGGNVNGIMDINLARRIAAGELPGPDIDATAPYVNGPSAFLQMHALRNADEARRHVAYWADQGATSVKAYMQISRDALRAAIDEAHKRGMKVTGHLCSVTYAEAADAGIDDLEHGFFASTDFVPDKQPDVCPTQGRGQQTIASLDPNGEPFKALVRKLVDKRVALTSTLTVFETLTPKRPLPPGLDVLAPQLDQAFRRAYDRAQQNEQSVYATLFSKGMALERAYAKAGGLLIAGTDPTGAGGVVPGFADQRQIELLVEAGFTPIEAIAIGTHNGAKYLGRDARIGSIAVGKQADLVVVAGDPSKAIGDIRRVETVFKRGVGYNPAKLIESVKGQVGIW
ncbi:MAG: amidohydrolase [Acidobacteria bacterium]|nr:MAG: amidohydrolase [Acidobacteriota bacterium]